MAMHRYRVDWSAPNHRDSGSVTLLASTQSSAKSKAKARLGKKVKERHLHGFTATNLQTIANWHRKQKH